MDISWKMKDCENGRKEPYVADEERKKTGESKIYEWTETFSTYAEDG